MVTIKTGYNVANRANFAAIQGHLYVTNGFDPVQVWNGIDSASRDAGIDEPTTTLTAPSESAGNTIAGTHLIRYRYRNSKTGYVSNPCPAIEVVVSSGGKTLTFTAGSNYTVSPDAKVDTIDFEMTPITARTFYRAASALNSAASATISITDDSLVQQLNCDDEYGSTEDLDVFTHEPPPLGTLLAAYKGRLWVAGDEAYTITATFTNGSNSVTGTGFSAEWAGKLIRDGSNTTAYRIATATTTALTLSQNWVGSTGSKTAKVYSPTPNRAYYSRLGYPESFAPDAQARDMLNGRADQLVGLWGRENGLYFFGKYSAERLAYNTDPSAVSSAIYPIKGNRGTFNQKCLVEAEGDLFSFDRQGIYLVSERPQHLSAAIDDVLTGLVDYEQSSEFHAAFDPRDRVALFFFVAAGDTTPKYAAAFDIDGRRWFLHRFLQGITASHIVPTSDGQVRLQLCDENGYTWFYGIEGSFDGVPPTSSAIGTATGTPTTTVISVTETLSTSPSLAGVTCYDPTAGEVRIIASNTANQVTLATAFSNAPPAGRVLYFGAIPFEYRSKWWNATGMENKIRPTHLLLSMVPGSATGVLRVRYYLDFSTTPETLTSLSSDRFPDGVSIVNGGTYIDILLDGGSADGFVPIPLVADFARSIQVRLSSERPDGDIRILDFQYAVKKGDVFEVIDE